MEIRRVLEQLHAELAYLNAAIESLEHLRDHGRQRSRQGKVQSPFKRSRNAAMQQSPAPLLPSASSLSPTDASVRPAVKESD